MIKCFRDETITMKDFSLQKEMAGITIEQALAEQEKLRARILKKKEVVNNYRLTNLTYFFKLYSWQKTFLELIRTHNITIAPAPNKIGKTAVGVNTVISWALGYEPWNEVKKSDAGAVRVGPRHYKPSSLGIKPPVKIRISGADWKYHLGQTVVPEIKKWAPMGAYETKKNEQGVEYYWTWKNGSTFEMLTYTQEFDISESWTGHAWWADEPPPKPMFGSMSRGIFLNNGKVFMTMTPLKEAWVLDDLVLSGRKDIAVIDGLTILDNEDLYNDEVSKLAGLGLSDADIAVYFDLLLYEDKEKEVFVLDKGKRAKMFLMEHCADDTRISELKLLRFVSDIEPQVAPSRLGGKFKSLIGRVLPPFDKNKHIVKPFIVPCDWPVIAMVDFHLNKPQAISFHAVNKQGVKFIIKEIWEHLSPEETADAIIRAKTRNAWRLESAYIDPLSKGDTAYMRNRMGNSLEDSFSIIERRLSEHDITLIVASKDKESGIRNILKELSGHAGIPTYYIFDICERHIFEVMRWVYDDDGKPEKTGSDHFCENWYRATLADLEYEELRPKKIHFEESRSTYAWLGA